MFRGLRSVVLRMLYCVVSSIVLCVDFSMSYAGSVKSFYTAVAQDKNNYDFY